MVIPPKVTTVKGPYSTGQENSAHSFWLWLSFFQILWESGESSGPSVQKKKNNAHEDTICIYVQGTPGPIQGSQVRTPVWNEHTTETGGTGEPQEGFLGLFVSASHPTMSPARS